MSLFSIHATCHSLLLNVFFCASQHVPPCFSVLFCSVFAACPLFLSTLFSLSLSHCLLHPASFVLVSSIPVSACPWFLRPRSTSVSPPSSSPRLHPCLLISCVVVSLCPSPSSAPVSLSPSSPSTCLLHTPSSSPPAFVTLLNGAQAQDAIRSLHHSTVRGRCISVALQPTDSLLCLANLPHAFTAQQFEELVRAYGNIERCFLVYSELTGHSKGYGFVEYMKKDSASRARSELLGRPQVPPSH